MLSHKCKYAIQAVIYIASQDSHKKLISGSEISNALNSPTAFTVKILQELVRKNIIHSSKGPGGGFYIMDDVKEIPILSIVEAIDNLDFFQTCGFGLAKCSDTSPCPFHNSFKEIRTKLYDMLKTRTIGDFCVDFYNDEFFLSNVR